MKNKNEFQLVPSSFVISHREMLQPHAPSHDLNLINGVRWRADLILFPSHSVSCTAGHCGERDHYIMRLQLTVSFSRERNGDYPTKQQSMLQRPRRRCEGTAMGAIVLDLKPGLGIGPFSLGNSFFFFFFFFPSQFFTRFN